MTDIDALLEEVVKIQASGGDTEKRVGEIILAITNTPTVEIVRCKDCKHYMTIHCTCDGCCIYDDWYCADGERKDNGI